MKRPFLSVGDDSKDEVKPLVVYGRLASFFVAPVGYLLVFTLWRALWAEGLLNISLFALGMFFILEYLLIRAGWDKPILFVDKILSSGWASIASAALRGAFVGLPAYLLLRMMRTLSWTAVFIPFVYEAEISLFASRAVLIMFWALALLIPFGLFLILKGFRVILSIYLPLAIVFGGFLSIYNSYDKLVGADKNLDPLVEVLCSRKKIVEASGAKPTLIARDIYAEEGVVFASFGSTVSPITTVLQRALLRKTLKPSVAIVRFDIEHDRLDTFFGSTVKYFFSRPSDPYLYFALWSEYSQIFRIKKQDGADKEPVGELLLDTLESWDKFLPLLSVMDIYVDRAGENLYFSADELPACFRMNLESKKITGEVNLLKSGIASWGSGTRRIHVDPNEQYMYIIPYMAHASVVKIDLEHFTISGQRPSTSRFGLFVFYHDVAFDWNNSIGYGFTYDGQKIEAFRLSDLVTIYEIQTHLPPYRLQVRGAKVLEDGRVIGVTYFGEIFMFDPINKKLSILCSRTGGRADDLEIVNGYVYLNNYAGIVRIPIDKLLERTKK